MNQDEENPMSRPETKTAPKTPRPRLMASGSGRRFGDFLEDAARAERMKKAAEARAARSPRPA